MSNITISHQFVDDLQALLEDTVEYSIKEAMENGERWERAPSFRTHGLSRGLCRNGQLGFVTRLHGRGV